MWLRCDRRIGARLTCHGPNQNGRFSCVGGLEGYRICLSGSAYQPYVWDLRRGKEKEIQTGTAGVKQGKHKKIKYILARFLLPAACSWSDIVG